MPLADHLFEAPLPAILKTTGSNGDDRTAAKRYLKEMLETKVDWESTAPGDGIKYNGLHLLAEVALEVRNGENWVAWQFPATIVKALREPARWARINLDVLASLSTYTAVALYEICARYRDNPGGVTSRKPVTWWADALSQTPAGTERREWRKFKNERVKPAIDEINAETDLEVELIEHKQGRAVVEAQFAVRKKKVDIIKRQVGDVVDANLVLRAESLGIRELKLEGLIKEFGEWAVRKQVEVLEQRSANSRLRGVENAYSYLRSLLRNGTEESQQAQAEVAAQADRQNRLPAATEPTPPAVAPAKPALAHQAVDQAWLNERRDSIRSAIQALSPEHRQALVDEVVQELTSKGLMTAVLSRRVAQGDILHGMLGAWMVRHYGTRLYGPDWDKPDAGDLFAGQA